MMKQSALIVAVAVVGAPGAWGQFVKDWHAVSTENFQLISRYDPANMGKLLEELEWFRGVFVTNLDFQPKHDRSVLIYLPDSPYEYEQTSPSPHADGYYMGAPFRDFIVLRSFAQARSALLHEYTHLVVRHTSGTSVPAWFNEGTAEFYATIQATKGRVEAGAPNPLRLRALRKGAWLPVSYMLAADSAAKLSSPEAMQKFYPQAWLYVHTLRLSPSYRDGFARFSGLISSDVAAEEAFRSVYGKSLSQFDDDARAWSGQKSFPTETLKPPAEVKAKAEARQIPLIEQELARFTIALAGPARPQAAKEYARLAKMAGEECLYQAPLGDLAYAGDLVREAIARYERAEGCGNRVTAAVEGIGGSAPRSGGTRVMDRPVEARASGDYSHLYFLSGTGRFFDNDFAGALSEFEKVSKLSQADHFRMTRVKALALARLNRHDEAEQEAGKLNAMAADKDQKDSARLTLEDVRRARQESETPPEPPHRALLRTLSRIEGEVVRVDCRSTGAVFSVRSGTGTVKLVIADPSEVVTGPGPNQPLEFACGPQKRPVVIGYRPQPDEASGAAGRIGYIEFR